jgi:hypothetical protein
MRIMLSQSRIFALLVAAAAVLLPASAARAQVYGASQPAPLYSYAMQNSVQSNQPNAVEVSPGTYVIQRSAPPREYPYVRSRRSGRGILTQPTAPAAGKFDRPHKPVDHALVEELRQRHQSKDNVNATQIVRDPPVVRETRRIVDDPPRVITRKHIVEDQPDGSQTLTVEESAPEQPRQSAPAQRPSRDDNKKRVIQADAEVTILGTDRMMIRLFRKGQGPKANARAD